MSRLRPRPKIAKIQISVAIACRTTNGSRATAARIETHARLIGCPSRSKTSVYVGASSRKRSSDAEEALGPHEKHGGHDGEDDGDRGLRPEERYQALRQAHKEARHDG